MGAGIARRTRAAQDLPAHVEDAAALRQVATLLDATNAAPEGGAVITTPTSDRYDERKGRG